LGQISSNFLYPKTELKKEEKPLCPSSIAIFSLHSTRHSPPCFLQKTKFKIFFNHIFFIFLTMEPSQEPSFQVAKEKLLSNAKG
jgi:hypothetical protein